MTGSTPPLAEVVGVSKTFGATRALTDVTLRVTQGRTHGLVGRNGAGKSTLVGVLTGLVTPDTGEVRFAGEPAPSVNAPSRWQDKVSCVYQHRRLVPTLSVAENLLLNRWGSRGGLVHWKSVIAEASRQLDAWQIDVDPRALATDLSVEDAQLVEIVRALSGGSRFVILDEPTAQLVASGIERLFGELRRLQDAGITFLFISHHLEEVEEICSEVTVLRNGTVAAAAPVSEMSQSSMVAAMVGRDKADATQEGVAALARSRNGTAPSSTPSLQVRRLRTATLTEPLDLDVRPGEIVGLAGHFGSGSRDVAACLVGLQAPVAGEILRDGSVVSIRSPRSAIRAGIGYLPEDRHREGYVPMLSISDNIGASVLHRLGRFGFVSPRRRAALARRLTAELDVVCSSTGQPVASLSGGNQQKVVLGRALAGEPQVLVLVHPTAGVDVASKDTLFANVEEQRRAGVAVLVVSDEVDELRRCDRVLVLLRGRLVREFTGDWDATDLVSTMEGVVHHA